MKHSYAATAVVVALCVLPATSHAGTLTTHSMSFGGLTRTWEEYVPTGLPSSAVPLVFALHGGNETADSLSQAGSPWHEWQVLADRDKFVVIYPNGANSGGGQQWHDCRSDWSGDGTADDVGFVNAMITDVSGRYTIDQSRIYSTGHSDGGLMSYRLAAEDSNKIAAIGVVIANRPVDAASECGAPANPTTVVIMNGDSDSIMPWNGGCVAGNIDCNGTVQSAFQTRDYWIGIDGTSTTPTTYNYPDINTRDGSTVTRSTYTGGTQGTEVDLFRVNGGGHSTPTIAYRSLKGVVGNQNWDIEGIDEIWAILKLHTLTS
jgi:polyhydroxybutyrate depolymerase